MGFSGPEKSVQNSSHLWAKHLIFLVFGFCLDQGTQENITANTQSKKKRVLGAFLGEYYCFALKFSTKGQGPTTVGPKMCSEEEDFDFDESDRECDAFLNAIQDDNNH